MKKYYCGVGSRKTPPDILNIMTEFATIMKNKNYILRSGGATGADKAFEAGAGNLKEIFYAKDSTNESIEIASKFHNAWNKCSSYAKKLHGRNIFQVMGRNLEKDNYSKFLICWTPDKCKTHKDRTIKTGGTGTAISIADYYNIPIINLANETDLEKIKKFIQTNKI